MRRLNSPLNGRCTFAVRPSQDGGTVMGVVIGLVIGTLVVAGITMWYGKTQSPVVNKIQTKEVLTPEQEAQKNKNWDPNRALFGKSVPASLQELATKTAALAASAAAAVGGDSVASEKPGMPTLVASSGESSKGPTHDPISELMKAKGQATGQVPPRAEDAGGVYYVQIGAFNMPEDAQTQKAKLAILGIESKVSEREQNGKTMFRVRAGAYSKLEEAEAMKTKLDKAGFTTALVKSPK